MSKTVTITPHIQRLNTDMSYLFKDLKSQLLNNEPSLFSCDIEHAKRLGGKITNGVIEAILRQCRNDSINAGKPLHEGLYPVIDVRVQRLMPGMYPSIPGWHCDNVPRCPDTGQPELDKVPEKADHFVFCVGTDDAPMTEFIGDQFDFMYSQETAVWKQLHQRIENTPSLFRYPMSNGSIVRMNSMTPHCARMVTTRCVRMFLRFSWSHSPAIGNRINKETQVYVLSEENGW